jgi:hypothetical protein
VAWTRYLWSDVRGVAWLATLSGLCMAPVTIVHYG